MVSWPFKKQRFATIHRQALRWPASRFDYVGVGTLGTDATTTSNVPNLRVGLLKGSLEALSRIQPKPLRFHFVPAFRLNLSREVEIRTVSHFLSGSTL